MPRPGQPSSAGSQKAAAEQPERQVEAVLLLGVDGEAEALPRARLRPARPAAAAARREPLLLARIEARMHAPTASPRSLGRAISVVRSLPTGAGVVRSPRSPPCSARNSARRRGSSCAPLAQHVVGEAVALRLERVRLAPSASSMVRPSTKLSPRILMAWRSGLADERLARARHQPLQRLDRIGALGLAELDDAARQHQPKVEALTNRLSESPRCFSQRRPISSRRSARPPCPRRECAAAPRRGTSG